MLKANFKSVFLITLITISVWLGGCKSPEEKKAAKINYALSLSKKGSNGEALKMLEELAKQYPDDTVILKSIGLIYASGGDAGMASLFLEQAYLLSPNDTDLLEKLAEQAPNAMTPELWIRLGQTRQAANQLQPALDAFLKGVDPDKAKPAPEIAAAIGQLFIKVGNLPQAESWLKMTADSDDPNALTALFGLLEVNLRQNNWADAEAIIAKLDTKFPGAVEASQWKQNRQELVLWRESQDEMKAKVAKAQANKKAIETNVRLATDELEVSQVAESIAELEGSVSATTKDKAQIIADMIAAEAMAAAPAIETTEVADVKIIQDNNAIASKPATTIGDTDPETTVETIPKQAAITEETTLAVNADTTIEPAPTPIVEAFPTLDAEPASITLPPSSRPQTVEELIADAETATLDRDFKSAIRKYWTAISIANNRAEVWNLLSRAYLVDGQLNNAETTALEAIRREPQQVTYTLDYLRVAQRSLAPEDFLAELETAYARFPVNPEITLSIARAHELISRDRSAARDLYLRFIDIAPNHPLIPEAQNAVARLR
ncbi:MAG: tetratricopeptide repeat protein [Verrucomicrobiota bacterium]|nr:tetratricopeptide repeat protein [Verrucomicrobiota bacterium]